MARVMVVDDEVEVRERLSRLLLADGHDVSQAGDGLAAIHQCRAQPPELIIVDLIMPEKEGLETIRELRSDYPNLRILAISGFGLGGTGSYLRLAERLGADSSLSKPISEKALRSAVAALLTQTPSAG